MLQFTVGAAVAPAALGGPELTPCHVGIKNDPSNKLKTNFCIPLQKVNLFIRK